MSTGIPDDASSYFTTTVGLITTTGSLGPNVMAAEWTYLVSYHPMRIMLVLSDDQATYRQIQETGEFGLSLCTDEMAAQSSFAGHYTRFEVDKLSSRIFETVPARHIRAPLIAGALLTAECRLVATFDVGDHVAVLGEVVAASVDDTKRPLILHSRSGYHRLGPRVERPHEVVIAATADGGRRVSFVGRLTGPGVAGETVLIRVVGPDGAVLAEAEARPNRRGYFHAEAALPDGARGEAVVEGRHDGVVGLARLRIEPREE